MLDSVGYLTSFGWKGKGKGLHEGSASRPLAIPQKRTLAGLGKDRDEAFPFWDHLFSAAAKSIKIKVSGDEEESEATAGSSSEPILLRTSTGILSNRRPVSLTPGTSGTVTPIEQESSHMPRLSLMAIAKRDTARKRLYATFSRGPVLGPELKSSQLNASVVTVVMSPTEVGNSDVQVKDEDDMEGIGQMNSSGKRTKGRRKDITLPSDAEHAKERTKKKRKMLKEVPGMEPENHTKTTELDNPSDLEDENEKSARKIAKLERRRRKAERRKIREERRKARERR